MRERPVGDSMLRLLSAMNISEMKSVNRQLKLLGAHTRAQNEIGASGNGNARLAASQDLDSLVDCNKTGRASSVYCHRRPAPIEEVRYSVRHNTASSTGRGVFRDGLAVVVCNARIVIAHD